MLIHSVFFWLKPDLSPEDRQRFDQTLSTLKSIECTEAVYIGHAVPSDRPVVDSSYDAALTLVFTDLAQHDTYQTHPLHKAFLESCSSLWDRVLIYDAQD